MPLKYSDAIYNHGRVRIRPPVLHEDSEATTEIGIVRKSLATFARLDILTH